VQAKAEAQRKAMEIERCELEVIAKRKCAILNRATLLEKGIKIPDLEQFTWTWMKENYDKHVEHMGK
jgi:hypothetical protein